MRHFRVCRTVDGDKNEEERRYDRPHLGGCKDRG